MVARPRDYDYYYYYCCYYYYYYYYYYYSRVDGSWWRDRVTGPYVGGEWRLVCRLSNRPLQREPCHLTLTLATWVSWVESVHFWSPRMTTLSVWCSQIALLLSRHIS